MSDSGHPSEKVPRDAQLSHASYAHSYVYEDIEHEALETQLCSRGMVCLQMVFGYVMPGYVATRRIETGKQETKRFEVNQSARTFSIHFPHTEQFVSTLVAATTPVESRNACTVPHTADDVL
jgi:hypothetical protein